MQQRSSMTITPADPIEEPACTSEVKSSEVSISPQSRPGRPAADHRLRPRRRLLPPTS
jgi:hypothetical protein